MARKKELNRAHNHSMTTAEDQRRKDSTSFLRRIKDSLGFGSKSRVTKIVPTRYNAFRYTENPTPLDTPIDNDTQSIKEAVHWGHVRQKRPFSWYRAHYGSKWVAANHLAAEREQRDFEKRMFYAQRDRRYHTYIEPQVHRPQFQPETDSSDQEQHPLPHDASGWYPEPWNSASQNQADWGRTSNPSSETLTEDTDFVPLGKPAGAGTWPSPPSTEQHRVRDWIEQPLHAEADDPYINTDDFSTTHQPGLRRRNAQVKRSRRHQPNAPKHAFTKPRRERSPAPSPDARPVDTYPGTLPSTTQTHHRTQPGSHRRRKGYKPKRSAAPPQDAPFHRTRNLPIEGSLRQAIDSDESTTEWLPAASHFYEASRLPEPPSRVTKYGYPQRKAIR